MKKRMLVGLLQYIGAIVLIACSILSVYAFDAGKLPFMDADYLETRKETAKAPPTDNVDMPVQDQRPLVTAASYISGLPQAEDMQMPYTGVYSSACKMVSRPLSALGSIGMSELALHMGFLVKSDSGNVQAVYDSTLADITGVINNSSFALRRDALGRALFYVGDGYAYYENGKLVATDYDSVNLDKGVRYEYPAYVAGYDSSYETFYEGGYYGLRTAAGAIIVPPKYADVYGMSEGYCIAVDSNKKITVFDKNGTIVSDKYYIAGNDDGRDIGYYFVRNGLTRVSLEDGTPALLRTDGSLFSVPSGFEVCAYSDGVVLLRGESGYGYMSSKGRWISTPDYSQAEPFYEGLAVVHNTEGKCGMIDTEGNVVVPMVFDSASNCSDGVVLLYAQKYGYYVINKVIA